MGTWRGATLVEVQAILQQELEELHPKHRQRFEHMRVTPRQIPVARFACGYVWVVAEHEGKVLYWSDGEEGWELDLLDSSGGIQDRGSNQFELKHIMYQLFGDPELM